jgi:hypothetical protein
VAALLGRDSNHRHGRTVATPSIAITCNGSQNRFSRYEMRMARFSSGHVLLAAVCWNAILAAQQQLLQQPSVYGGCTSSAGCFLDRDHSNSSAEWSPACTAWELRPSSSSTAVAQVSHVCRLQEHPESVLLCRSILWQTLAECPLRRNDKKWLLVRQLFSLRLLWTIMTCLCTECCDFC